jgi:hypothetical protein
MVRKICHSIYFVVDFRVIENSCSVWMDVEELSSIE